MYTLAGDFESELKGRILMQQWPYPDYIKSYEKSGFD